MCARVVRAGETSATTSTMIRRATRSEYARPSRASRPSSGDLADHDDQRHVAGLGLHAVHRLLDDRADALDGATDERPRQVGHAVTVAEVQQARRDADVGGGERGPAEDTALRRQPVADAEGADR